MILEVKRVEVLSVAVCGNFFIAADHHLYGSEVLPDTGERMPP